MIEENTGYALDWLFVSHEYCKIEQLIDALQKRIKEPGVEVWFKMEAPILALCARSIEHAQKMINVARGSGIKRASITGVKDRIMLVLFDSKRIEAPIAIDGNLIITNEYLEILIKQGNEKLAAARERFDKLKIAIGNSFGK